jgi:predicted metalloendopeptidase
MSKKFKYHDDFFTYINYDWLQTAKIPEDETRYTHFVEVQNRINHQLVELIKKSSLLSKLYSSYLNKSYRNSKTINELKYIYLIV